MFAGGNWCISFFAFSTHFRHEEFTKPLCRRTPADRVQGTITLVVSIMVPVTEQGKINLCMSCVNITFSPYPHSPPFLLLELSNRLLYPIPTPATLPRVNATRLESIIWKVWILILIFLMVLLFVLYQTQRVSGNNNPNFLGSMFSLLIISLKHCPRGKNVQCIAYQVNQRFVLKMFLILKLLVFAVAISQTF